MTSTDDLWFAVHPKRRYRLRCATPDEVALWPVQPPRDHIAWALICREPRDVEMFSQHWTDTYSIDDSDDDLEPLFGDLCRPGEIGHAEAP